MPLDYPPNRVCIRLADGSYVGPAYALRARTPGDRWVPVPDSAEGQQLALRDLGRPCGVHPAVWYGWPRERPDTRPEWTLESAQGTRVLVRADTLAGAVLASGLQFADLRYVELHPQWW